MLISFAHLENYANVLCWVGGYHHGHKWSISLVWEQVFSMFYISVLI